MPYLIKPGCRVGLCSNRRPCPMHPDPKPFAGSRRSEERYGPVWRATSAAILRSRPGCEWNEGMVACEAKATTVDHITPRAEGGTDDVTNLRPLCRSHHAKASGRYAAARKARIYRRADA